MTSLLMMSSEIFKNLGLDLDLGLGSGQSKHSVLCSTEIDDENNGNLVKKMLE